MKDNISIIFAAIIGTFLIVLLPLYSILDRQDSMSYNVVLTETTNFVDEIRNNGFIDKESYYNYISALASTSNTYKVNIEAYKKTLIHETDEAGNIIPDSYVEVIELDNTKDILQVIEGEKNIDVSDSNKKNNVYLLSQNDEIYIKVYNTNITSGSIIYNIISGVSDRKVIDVSYGGVINKVNWELYHQIQEEGTKLPEVALSVPMNRDNSTNIVKVTEKGTIDCNDGSLSEEERAEYCEEQTISNAYGDYTYLYDLSKTENKTIKIAVELRQVESIVVGINSETGEERFKKLSELTNTEISNETNKRTTTENYIIQNYIQLNGMYANKDLQLREKGDYYVLDIILTNVRMRDLDYISSLASVMVLPGLGKDENGTLSLGAETIQIELLDTNVVNEVTISGPYNWKKFLKEKTLEVCEMPQGKVFANMDIAFVINFSGVNGHTDEEIIDAIRQGLIIHDESSEFSSIEIYTEEQMQTKYNIPMATTSARHIVVKFRYDFENNKKINYLQLQNGWIETNIDEIIEEQEGEELLEYAAGATSEEYEVLSDNYKPFEPKVIVEGTKGKNNWYVSNVTAILEPSVGDNATENGQNDGSGVDKSIMTFSGANEGTLQYEKNGDATSYELSSDGRTTVVLKAYDYVGNISETTPQTIKIDKTAPTKPTLSIVGTTGLNGWYTSDVRINVTPGTDATSGVDRTTIKIDGANSLQEREGTTYKLDKEGISTVVVTTYDKAGNKSEEVVVIKIDKSTPPDAVIALVSGSKHTSDTKWYHTDVTLRITVSADDSVSGLGTCSYRITGNSEVPITQFENTTDITITQNGTHNITVYTYTKAGNVKTTQYTVDIDKNPPNSPNVNVVSGTRGENNWYTSDVEVEVTSNGDIGPSKERMLSYTITTNGITTVEREIQNGGKIFLNQDGEHVLKIYAQDVALNKVEVERIIKIDKTNPTAAEFVINGNLGKDDWYTSNVYISYENQKDDISGIQSVTVSHESITQNTNGTEVTLTTKDMAGNKVTKTTIIKVDNTVPTNPQINFKQSPTGNAFSGMYLYNKDVEVNIVGGTDNQVEKTTYEVTMNQGATVLIPETVGSALTLTQNGIITVIARTSDIAGNVSTTTKVIWINKYKPTTPKIISINGTNVENITTSYINGTNNTVNLQVNGLSEGNDVKITLINQSTYVKKEINLIAPNNGSLSFNLNKGDYGTYSISITQTNMFGSTSELNSGLYYYTYNQ